MNKPISKTELLTKCGLEKDGGQFTADDATVIIEDSQITIYTYDERLKPVGKIIAPVPINHIQFQSKNLKWKAK